MAIGVAGSRGWARANRGWVIIFTLVAASIAWSARATAQSLINGGVVTGTIATVGQQDTWTFAATKGQGVLLNVAPTGANLIPWFTLYDPTGAVAAYSTHPGGSATAAYAFQPSMTGAYTLVVTDTSPSTGPYSIHFTSAPGVNELGPLINGGVRSDTLDVPGDLASFTFAGIAGEGVQLRVVRLAGGQHMSPQFTVYDPTGAAIASPSSTEVALYAFQPTVTGTYTVVVYDSSMWRTGSYNVYFTSAPGANELGALINGGVRSGTLGYAGLNSFTFAGTAGEGVQLRVASPGDSLFRPELWLYDPTGALIASPSGTEVATYAFQPATTGTYTLVVDSGYYSTSPYNVYFTSAPGAHELGALASGIPGSDSVDLGDLDSYIISAHAGDVVQLSVTDTASESLQPAFSLYSPSGALIASPSGTTTASYTFTAATAGFYTVVVYDSSGTGTGSYSIVETGATPLPAVGVTGTWDGTWAWSTGTGGPLTWVLCDDGSKVTGTWSEGSATISGSSLTGVTLDYGRPDVYGTCDLSMDGLTLAGNCIDHYTSGPKRWSFGATRVAGASCGAPMVVPAASRAGTIAIGVLLFGLGVGATRRKTRYRS
jgi:hypothetical protein